MFNIVPVTQSYRLIVQGTRSESYDVSRDLYFIANILLNVPVKP